MNARVESVLEELRATRNEVSSLKSKIAVLRASNVASKALVVGPNNIRYYHIFIPLSTLILSFKQFLVPLCFHCGRKGNHPM